MQTYCISSTMSILILDNPGYFPNQNSWIMLYFHSILGNAADRLIPKQLVKVQNNEVL
mgnify:FL=1|jgi:hypothetical protein